MGAIYDGPFELSWDSKIILFFYFLHIVDLEKVCVIIIQQS